MLGVPLFLYAEHLYSRIRAAAGAAEVEVEPSPLGSPRGADQGV